MKVLLISAENVYLIPYINMYKNLLDKCNIEWNVLYWDKNQNEVIEDARYERFVIKSSSKLSKIKGYVSFRKRIKQLLKSGEYGFVIPLHTVVNILIWRYLSKKYRQKYIVDVRDYSYEKFSFVRWIEKQLVNNSCINVVSSEGFKYFLPQAEYNVMHNMPKFDYEKYRQNEIKRTEPYEISYIGLIRFMEQNKKIIDFFKNDSRFHLNFIGTNAEQLKAYCVENQVENVSLIGTFEPQKTLDYLMETDLIMNLYGNRTPLLDYALSNKLYYAAMLYKPILVCEDTFMEEISKKYGFGFTITLENHQEKDELYNYMKQLRKEDLVEKCDEFISIASQQNDETLDKITRIFESLKNE